MSMTTVELAKQEWTIGDAGTLQRVWRIFGTRSIAEVKTQILAVAEATYQSKYLDPNNIKIKEIGRGGWECTVPYTRHNYADTSTVLPPTVFSFRTTGGTEKITQTDTCTGYAASGETVPSYDGGINVNKSGSGFEGVDRDSKSFDFDLEQYLPPDAVNNALLATLISLKATVNNAPWRGLNAGECKYKGVQGTQDSGGAYRLNHSFSGSPNRTAFTVANGKITVASCKGWEYIWVYYKPGKDSSNKPALKPVAAFVHPLYVPSTFTLIGLGS